jgi:lipopolysaccharide/colanic/teichoic acid biosynthesis glycosyltransferase
MWYRRIKRAIDVGVALVALAVFALPMLAVALAIRRSLGRPVLFRQRRMGRGEQVFEVLKFRTMRSANGPDGQPLPDAERLTALGRFLRRTSLDELPQLFNVLRGEMSLVGPRPLLVDYLEVYTPRERRRHEVLPGITGLAQVSGRNRLSWDERLELDVQYVERLGPGLDARILLQTVAKVLARSDTEFAEGDAIPLTEYRRRRSGQALSRKTTA